MSLTKLTATELLTVLNKGEATAEFVTNQFLEKFRQLDGKIRAFLHVDEDIAIEQARAIDKKRSRDLPLGPLAGIPVAVKDVLCTCGQPTTCGSKILQHFLPTYDAHVITRLKQADAVILGKTNCDEFAMGSSTENSAFQTTRNPWDLVRTPGGSSGGSAAAVAACESPVALGTDTGGSIRQPASLCGIVGLKPTYGRVSRFGLVAYASSLDQIGPLAHDVADATLLFMTIAGHDSRDSTSANLPVTDCCASLEEPLNTLTVGVALEHMGQGLDDDVELNVRNAIEVFQSLGAVVKEVSLPHSRYAVATYYLVATAEASSNLARYDGVHFGHRAAKYDNLIHMYLASRGEGFGAEVKRRIMLGTYCLSSGYKDRYYLKALQVRQLIKEDFDRAFTECDVIVGPTSPTPAFTIGERMADPLAMYLSDICTISCNLAGLPGISVPCGFTKGGLPIGLQILAPHFAEEKLLRVARMYERETEWHLARANVQ